MSRVVEDDLGVRIITAVSLRPGREKERIVLSPDGESWRAMRAEVLLKLRIKRHVAFVVTDEVELNLSTLRAIQQSLVEKDGFRRNALLGIGDAVMILPASGFQGGKAAEDIPVLLSWIFPVGSDRSPVFAQTFLIGVSILGDDGRNSLRVIQSETEPGRGAIVEDVDRKLPQADLLREFADDLGQMLKRIGEFLVIRRV